MLLLNAEIESTFSYSKHLMEGFRNDRGISDNYLNIDKLDIDQH